MNEKNLRKAIRMVKAKIGATLVEDMKGDRWSMFPTGFADGIYGVGYDFDKKSWFVGVKINAFVSNVYLGVGREVDYAEIAEAIEIFSEIE